MSHRSIAALMFHELRKHPDTLTAYADDWATYDLDALHRSKPGDKFLWVIRDHGSHIFTDDKTNATGALHSMPDTARFYLVTVHSEEKGHPRRKYGTVEPVNLDQACRFLRQQSKADCRACGGTGRVFYPSADTSGPCDRCQGGK